MNIPWKYVSRTGSDERFTYNEIDEAVLLEHKIVVNCSPVGTFPKDEECPDIPYRFLTHEHLLYDLIYNPSETLFLKKGKTQGATIKNGAEMLELQALAAWEIWSKQ
ncbi:shikimate dehydrogenase [Petrimonas sp. IBARAKI]|nr:shikimate dehydrogenase [Petrimonas sp. IBARAKI]